MLLGLSRVEARAPDTLQPDVRAVQDAVRTSLEEVRRIAIELRLKALEHLGLASALAVMAERFAERTELKVTLRIAPELPQLPTEDELVIYRVAQEALTNVARHAGVDTAQLTLDHQDGRVVLEVRDRGPWHGLSPPHPSGERVSSSPWRRKIIVAVTRLLQSALALIRAGGGSRAARTLLASVAVSIALAACGGGSKHPATVAVASPNTGAAQKGDSFSRIPSIVQEVQPEVVTVLTGQGVGSGVIYRADGVILTNAHVVGANNDVQIAFADGRREPGKVLAADSYTDLALVKVTRNRLPTATFQLKLPPVGALAVVLGSPLGFDKSVTAGIVSGLHREIPGSAQESSALVDLLQTDAPISPGNSGGAVVDSEGHVIGIAEAYIPPEQGAVAIGFAIPAATAVSVANELLKTGHVEHAFIGIQPAQLTPQLAQELGIQETAGVLVYGVTRGGPADQAHIQPGDVLVKLADKPLETVEGLFAALRGHRSGQTVAIELVRAGKRETVQLKLSAKSQ